MSKRSRCPLVMVEWEDSVQPESSWRHLADLGERAPVVCRSVGWVISTKSGVIVLAPNLGAVGGTEDVQVSGIITIPARCVRKKVRLREPG